MLLPTLPTHYPSIAACFALTLLNLALCLARPSDPNPRARPLIQLELAPALGLGAVSVRPHRQTVFEFALADEPTLEAGDWGAVVASTGRARQRVDLDWDGDDEEGEVERLGLGEWAGEWGFEGVREGAIEWGAAEGEEEGEEDGVEDEDEVW